MYNVSVIKVKLRRFAARYLTGIAQLYMRVYFCLISFAEKESVIILTMGKVGSSSVYYALKGLKKYRVFHVHYLTPETIERSRLQHLNSVRRSVPLHLIVANELNRKMSKSHRLKVKIITIIREPFGRTISSCFQNADQIGGNIEKSNLELDVDKVCENLSEKISCDDNVCFEEKWFREELYQPFLIDVFSKELDSKKGYSIYTSDKADLLLIRMDELSSCFTKAIEEFLGVSNVRLSLRNLGATKVYQESYQSINNKLRFSDSVLDTYLEGKFVNKFFSDKKAAIKAKWWNGES